jgi:UPF0271 protein
MQLDLNADLGEGMGDDAAMLSLVTSANVACGGHASDPDLMLATLRQAHGARRGGGRASGLCRPGELRARGGADGPRAGHGPGGRPDRRADRAWPRFAARGWPTSRRMARWRTWPPTGARSRMRWPRRQRPPGWRCWRSRGPSCRRPGKPPASHLAEIFADRAYLSTGRLVPRSHPQAMLHDPEQALHRLISYLDTGLMPVIDGPPIPLAAQSVCIHGDSPDAVTMARTLRDGLARRGVTLAPFCR